VNLSLPAALGLDPLALAPTQDSAASPRFAPRPAQSSSAAGSAAASALAGSASAAASPDQRKLQKAAGDFESILLATLWKGMKAGLGGDESDSDPAHGTLEDWGIEIMSSAVGRAGGLGIGKLILEHLDPKSAPQRPKADKIASNRKA
jgi:Rod binding domain-containing protein